MIERLVGAIIGLVVVLPVVILLSARVLRAVVAIRRTARDILKDGVTLTGDLDPAPALLDTQSLVAEVTGNAVSYLTALDPLLRPS